MESDLLVSGLLVFSPVVVLIALMVVFRHISKKDREGLEKKKQEIAKFKKEILEYGEFEILHNAYKDYESKYQSADKIDELEIEFVMIDKKISTEYANAKDQHNEFSNWRLSLIGIFISYYLATGIIEYFSNYINQALSSDYVILYKVVSTVVFLALLLDITIVTMYFFMKFVYASDKKNEIINEEYLEVLLFNDKSLEIRKIVIKNRIDELKRIELMN